jgi:preprotein translocase subunit SecE
VSDERDDADVAADGGADEPRGGRTAVVTRPQRPTGKRSRQRAEAGDDDESSSGAVELTESTADEGGKKAKKKKARKGAKPDGQSTNPVSYVYTYLKQVVAELRKVIWPSRKQMGTYTSVVLAFLVFMVTLIGLVDLGLARLVLWVFG